jgi:methanogenic corrinoid protein MtbC1
MGDVIQGSGPRGRDADAANAADVAIRSFVYLGKRIDRHPALTSGDAASETAAARTLMRVIEGEIIPRLLLAHRVDAVAALDAAADAPIDAAERTRFLDLVLRGTAAETRSFVDGVLARGVSHETLFLDLLSHTARRLGELWEEDLCDFADVTIGLCRLHEVLRERSSIHEERGAHAADAVPRILLATACSDQHVFGVVMVAEFFRRAGWRVWSEPGAHRSQLAAILAELRFDVLGLSAACSTIAEDLASEVAMLRKASCNRELRVLVGGRLLAELPDLAARVGADAAAGDARSAPDAARVLLPQAFARSAG